MAKHNDPIAKTHLRMCKKGHQFFKTSDCPTCPTCEQERKPKEGFLATLYAPARRALENNGIFTLEQLSQYTESELLKLHGIGKTAIPKLKAALEAVGLKFHEKITRENVS